MHDIRSVSDTQTSDFWTTRCTRCPAALDQLDERAQKHPDVTFLSVCCDKLDGARSILEAADEPRWSNVQHYYMAPDDKEAAKTILGFSSVPFYVVVNEGTITQLGNKIDWDEALPTDKENEDFVQVQEERVFVLDDLDF